MNKSHTFNTYLYIQLIFDFPKETVILLSQNFLAGFLLDQRTLSYPDLGTPQASRDLLDDQASMGVPFHEEESSPTGYRRVSYRKRPKNQHTADMYVKLPWPKFSVQRNRQRQSGEK